MARDRLSVEERSLLLHGGDTGDGVKGRGGAGAVRGALICACFGVSCASVESAIADGAVTLDAVGGLTRAVTNCGSCRPEIRALLRAARLRKAA